MISFVTEVKKVKFFLELAMKAQMGSRGIAVLLALHGVGDQCHILTTVFLGEIHSTHFTEGWVGSRASLDRCRKSGSDVDSIPRSL
jgi:hypothetical protein